MLIAACCQAFNTDFRTVVEAWRTGELSESLCYGGFIYNASSGRSLASALSGIDPSPRVMRKDLRNGQQREITSCSNPQQLMNSVGLKEPDVDIVKQLLAGGLPLGIPEEVLSAG